MDSGVHASLHPNCHHQIVYAKLNLKIEYPPLYERLVWDYKKTNTQLLNRTIETFNWEKLFENKNVNEQLYLFNKAMLNIFHNFISNKNIICNDKDPLNLTIKSKHWLRRNRFRLQKEGEKPREIIKQPKHFLQNVLVHSEDFH